MDRDEKLLAYRVRQLEESQRLLADSLGSISETIISMRAWGKAAMFIFGIVHPVLVAIIIRVVLD